MSMYIKLISATLFAAGVLLFSYKEKPQRDHTLAFTTTMSEWSTNLDWSIACNQEHLGYIDDPADALPVNEIKNLATKAMGECLETIGVIVGKLAQTAPSNTQRAKQALKLAKIALKTEEARCTDYTTPLIYACPALLEPQITRLQSLGSN